jgi:(1->4)-alpha-D-glucan 1-alpha-D-glucosylmutase
MPDLNREFLAALQEAVMAAQYLPESTYRVQFHAGFTFRDALEIVPYLHDLGITHLYASPLLQARPGSTHGYDTTNHQAFNPELGTAEDYEELCQVLQLHGMGQVLDIVPNHMGVAGNANQWYRDVLENGPASPYSGFFDIAWYDSPRVEMHERLLLPGLGKAYGEALESQEIQLQYASGAFTIHYFDHCWPVAPQSYALILEQRRDELATFLGEAPEPLAEYDSILTAIRNLPLRSETDPARVAESQREKEVIKRRLAALTEANPSVRAFLEDTVVLFNGTPGQPESFDLLDTLLQAQVYRLCHWRVASEEINYRRFFDVNELAALSMEKLEVFTATHGLILRLLSEGKVHGVRIDHPDGLYDPQQYFQRLQQHYVLHMAHRLRDTDAMFQDLSEEELTTLLDTALAQASNTPEAVLYRPLYMVVEKILGAYETLREDWPVYGTSGYDFLNVLNGLFVDAEQRRTWTRLYREWTQDPRPFAEIVYGAKYLIMQMSLSSEVYMLAHRLDRLAQQHRGSRDLTFNSLRRALQHIIACFPVYRSYISSDALHPDDQRYIQQAASQAQRRNPTVSSELFAFVRDILLLQYHASASVDEQAEQRRFVGKFQQVTAPIMAKGLEDTALYVYNRLLSLNDVGGDADRFGVSPEEVHRTFWERQAKWPWAFSALSTHDTKRSEDVRARLNVLSELPHEWQASLQRWSNLNAQYRRDLDDAPVPDANEEYLFYQTLLGAWPLEPYSPEEYTSFVERIQAYMLKVLREAKVHTSWINPNPVYEEAVQRYIARVLNTQTQGAFLEDFLLFQRCLSHYGLFNSLAQTLLKITAPGVPDTYQGTELWDLSLVDPDNRRAVDYKRRYDMLRSLRERLAAVGEDRRALIQELLTQKEDGRLKLYVTTLALNCRRMHPGLFSLGSYTPAQGRGAKGQYVFGFSRCQDNHAALVVVPRLIGGLLAGTHAAPLGAAVWQDTRLLVPGIDSRWDWRNVLTGEPVIFATDDGQPALALAELLGHCPVALLVAQMDS